MAKSVYQKKTEKGVGMVEYALITFFVAVVIVVVLLILGPTVANMFAKVNTSLSSQSDGQGVVQATSTPIPWTTCANENGFCSFSGTAQVRYGAGSSWATGTFTNGVACNNSVFGDPDFGVVKTCQIQQ